MRMHGPEYLSDDELLRRALERADDLERTVRELDRSAFELEPEQDEAKTPRPPARTRTESCRLPMSWNAQRTAIIDFVKLQSMRTGSPFTATTG